MPGASELRRRLEDIERRAQDYTEESTLRQEFVEAIRRFLDDSGVARRDVAIVLDQRLIRGKPDARVGGVLFEVKLPKPRGAGLKAAIDQAHGYLEEFKPDGAGRGKWAVAYDGLGMALLDETGKVVFFGRPAEAAGRVEAWLVTLAGQVIEPEEFVKRLGPKSEIAAPLIQSLWDVFKQAQGSVGFVDEVYEVWSGLYGVTTNLNDKAQQGLRRTARAMGIPLGERREDAERYLFVIETYLAILMKLLVARVAVQQRLTPSAKAFVADLLLEPREALTRLRDMGRDIPGITGVFEEDVFLWPVDAVAVSRSAEENLGDAVFQMARVVDDVDMAGASQDFLRLVYQGFLDSATRRTLGEFYTSPELVRETLDAVEYTGDASKRLVDISCGSGTFLVEAIGRAIRSGATLEAITRNIQGVDIHPFAVAMTRVNYLLAIAPLLPAETPVQLPIFWADSLLRLGILQSSLPGARRLVKVPVAGLGEFRLPDPRDVEWDKLFRRTKEAVERFKAPADPERVLQRFWDGVPDEMYSAYKETIDGFVRQIVERHNQNRDTRWLPLLQNALGIDRLRGSCDYVVGNPPWVRIHNISSQIRERLFAGYDLYMDAGWRLGAEIAGAGRGFARQADYALAFVERGLEFLKPDGRLGFIITSKVTSALYGNAFRKKIAKETRILYLGDYSLHGVPLFQDAVNYPLVLAIEKGAVPKGHQTRVKLYGPRRGEAPLEFLLDQMRLPLLADCTTINGEDALESPWINVPQDMWKGIARMQQARRMRRSEVAGSRFLLGQVPERHAQMGVKTGLNRVFLVTKVQNTERPDEVLVHTEGYDSASEKDKAKYTARVERSIVRPMIRGEDIAAWHYDVGKWILWTHDDGSGEVLRTLPPRAGDYFRRHEAALKRRDDFKKGMPPWTIFRTGSEKLGRKVGWQELSSELGTTVVPDRVVDGQLGRALLVPLQTLYFIPVKSSYEGYLLAGWLNSIWVRSYVASFSPRARGAYFRHFSWVVGLVPVPEELAAALGAPGAGPPGGRGSPARKLATLSAALHRAKNAERRAALERELNEMVGDMYNLSSAQRQALQSYWTFVRPEGAGLAASEENDQGEQ